MNHTGWLKSLVLKLQFISPILEVDFWATLYIHIRHRAEINRLFRIKPLEILVKRHDQVGASMDFHIYK